MDVLEKTLHLHKLWLEGVEGGKRLVWGNSNLRGVDLREADLK